MVSLAAARKLALSLPEAEERDHFGSPSFRVKGKIFAQLSDTGDENPQALVKLPVADQAALIMSDPDTFSAVPQWGRYGWTHVRLVRVRESMLREVLGQSWRLVAPKKLVAASSDARTQQNRRGG